MNKTDKAETDSGTVAGEKLNFATIRGDILKGGNGFGKPEKAEEKPSWLVALDKQIQRSKGSTKRRLQRLREQQLTKYEEAQAKAIWNKNVDESFVVP